MSDIPAGYPERLNLAEAVARIERNQAEIAKLFAESAKLNDEAAKLRAEGRKFRWDPVFLILGAVIAGIFARLPEILRAVGVGG